MQAKLIKLAQPAPDFHIAYIQKGENSHGVVCTPFAHSSLNPFHSGVYYTRYLDSMGDENLGYAHYDADQSRWTVQHETPEDAAKQTEHTSPFRYEWLALTVNPEHLYPYSTPEQAHQTAPLDLPVSTASDEDDEL